MTGSTDIQEKIRKKKDKAIKLRKDRTWLSIVLYVVLFILFSTLVVAGLAAFLSFLTMDSISSETKTAVGIFDQVGDSTADGGSADLSILEGYGHDYVLLGKGNNVIASSGKTTWNRNGSISVFFDTNYGGFYSKAELKELEKDLGEKYETVELECYSDTESDVFFFEDGEVSVRLGSIVSIRGIVSALNEEKDFPVPLWISEDLPDGSTLIIKLNSVLTYKDLVLTMLFILFSLLFALLGTILFVISLTTRIRAHRRMTHLLFLDYISDNHNWLYFMIRGRALITKRKNASRNFAIVNLVFSDYRNYVLCHSLEEGEAMLHRVYLTVSAELDPDTEMCAHSTSSNFPLILTYLKKADLNERLEKIFSSLTGIDTDHAFSFKAGVITLPSSFHKKRKDIDLDVEYNKACTACASIEGKSGIAFFNRTLVEEQQWLDTVHEHRQGAIENEEFKVYYQPKYDPRTNELKGAEALIRWDSPDFGLVSPGRFIPIFEKDGFIKEIDHYMLTHVARDIRKWLDEGKTVVPISVNVSRAHFIEADLASQIRDIADREGAPHELLEIELTESAFFDDKNSLVETITELKSYGFVVSMDDFGSGYSSLNSLKDMPLDILKIDADFFRGGNADGRSEIIVSEAIRLAGCLNMKTVAEGIEVKDQVDFLAKEGCDMIQGYYFAKPMPKEEFEERLSGGDAPEEDHS